MKKLFFSLLLLLLIPAKCLLSQGRIEPAFISVANKYEFTLPQFDISIPLPANAQFMVPEFTGKNIKLDVDDVTCYYFDLSYLETPGSFNFYFQLPSANNAKDHLMMNIIGLNKEEVEEKINDAVFKKECKRISGIKTKLGKAISYQVIKKDGSVQTEFHVITKGEYSLLFTLDGNLNKKLKKQYLNIIKSIYEKNQPYLKVRYETRVKNGEFEPKEEKVITTPMGKHTGELASPTFFEWPELGYGVQIPAGWEYEVESEMVTTGNHSKLLLKEHLSEDNFMTISWFRNKEFSLILRSYHKVNPSEMVEYYIQMTKYSQPVEIVVDGTAYQASYYGTKEYGTLDFCFEGNGTNHWVSFSSVSKNTLPDIQKILSTMKINNGQSKDVNMVVPDLSAVLELEDLSPVEIDEPLVLNNEWPESETEMFECKLSDLDIITKLPGKPNEYLYTIGDSKKTIEKDGMVYGLPENDTDKRLMLFSLTGSPISLGISKKTQAISHEEYVKNFKRGWSMYNNMEFVHGSVYRINDLDWSVCISRNDTVYLVLCSCYIGEHEIMVSSHYNNSKDDAIKSIAYLKHIYYNE